MDSLIGPLHWKDKFPMCDDAEQSPINLDLRHCDYKKLQRPLRYYKAQQIPQNVTIENSGYSSNHEIYNHSIGLQCKRDRFLLTTTIGSSLLQLSTPSITRCSARCCLAGPSRVRTSSRWFTSTGVRWRRVDLSISSTQRAITWRCTWPTGIRVIRTWQRRLSTRTELSSWLSCLRWFKWLKWNILNFCTFSYNFD